MPAKKKKSDLINLLPQEEFASSTLGRILTWLLSTFRMIVIVSEMVVMSAFLSRFWLDARNTDLSEQIQQKQSIVASYKTLEENFRGAQKKLTIFSSLISNPNTPKTLLGKITSSLPSTVQMISFSITKDEVSVRGTSLSEQSINLFISNLEATGMFDEVNLTQASVGDNSININFTIKALLKGGRSGA